MKSRLLLIACLLLLKITLFSQEKVYRSVQFPAKFGFIMEGNFNYTIPETRDDNGISNGPEIKATPGFFTVYTSQETDTKMIELTTQVNSALDTLKSIKERFDSSVIAYNKTLIENIDALKVQIKQEAFEELKRSFQDVLKTEIDKVRSDMQKQIDELKKKIH